MEEKNAVLDNSTKKLLIWFFIILAFITIIGLLSNKDDKKNNTINIVANNSINETNSTENTTSDETLTKITVPDFKNLSKEDIKNWCTSNNVKYSFDEAYSDKIEKGKIISQSIDPNDVMYENDEITITYSLGKRPTVTVPDFSKMSRKEIEKWCDKNNIDLDIEEDYSSKVEKGKLIKQSVKAKEKIEIDDEITITYSLGRKPTTEDLNALEKAKSYSYHMHMSKKGIYDQLTSEYGENFDKESAQYAIDNLDENWNYNALQKAKSYQETMHMSKKSIYQQLISKYGEQFTKSEAQYAIDHLDD